MVLKNFAKKKKVMLVGYRFVSKNLLLHKDFIQKLYHE